MHTAYTRRLCILVASHGAPPKRASHNKRPRSQFLYVQPTQGRVGIYVAAVLLHCVTQSAFAVLMTHKSTNDDQRRAKIRSNLPRSSPAADQGFHRVFLMMQENGVPNRQGLSAFFSIDSPKFLQQSRPRSS